MYTSVQIAERIKSIAKSKNITIKTVLEECGLNKNTLSTMISRKSLPNVDTIEKIATYLNVSIDYLLGRTDNENLSIQSNNKQSNNLISVSRLSVGAVGDNSNGQITINETYKNDELTNEMIYLFEKLSISEKINLVHSLYEKTGKK